MAKDEYLVEGRKDQQYVIGDALEQLRDLSGRASVIHFDDAWARPHRAGQFGVTYPTHEIEQTKAILDACKEALRPGGWLIADGDDWVLPHLINYLQETWGNVAKEYRGGGYRRIGGVTYVTKDRKPDCSTSGAYLTNGGYPVVFAHKGETERVTGISARQLAKRQREQFGWGSVKPIAPYYEWLRGLYDPANDGILVVPCAGTAPAAIAAEQLYHDDVYDTRPDYVCIDCEQDAYQAFHRRRDAELKQPPSHVSD
jgi:hypothetical protein